MNKEYLNEENENENVNIQNGIRTDPRKSTRSFLVQKSNRTPLKSIQANSNTDEKLLLKALTDKKTQSEPIITSKNRFRIQEKFANTEVSYHKTDNQENTTTKIYKKNIIKFSTSTLAKLLDYDTYIEDELGLDEKDSVKLFNFLQNEGNLSPEILKTFSKCKNIKTVNMTKSYAGILGESELLTLPKFTSVLCTKAFYSGFSQVLSIDFTNVNIRDDEIRYLIKLSKLQALGLSGTLITDKSIKYLSTHAAFKECLKCLKLCYISEISDSAIKFLNSFTKLNSLDLRGNEQITLKGYLELNLETNINITDLAKFQLRVPQKIMYELSERHLNYSKLSSKNINLILDPKDSRLDEQSVTELKYQLKQHKHIVADIYLAGDMNTLRTKLLSILKIRKKEELLYSCCSD